MACRQFVISGKVQGVFYRASTQQQAQLQGLTGWVKNRADGKVEAVACGSELQLDAFENWLAHGPPMAVVEQVSVQELKNQTGLNDFIITR